MAPKDDILAATWTNQATKQATSIPTVHQHYEAMSATLQDIAFFLEQCEVYWAVGHDGLSFFGVIDKEVEDGILDSDSPHAVRAETLHGVFDALLDLALELDPK